MRSRILLPVSACLLFCAAGGAYGTFSIEPSQVVFFVEQGEKTVFFELVHLSGGPAAVQFSVHERVLDIDGKLANSAGTHRSSDLLVHPSQVILYPNERASVQVQYRGKGKITADRAYVIFSKEVPIELDEEGSNVKVNFLTNYYTTVALETNKPSKLVFVSSKAISGGKIEVIAENKGAGRVPIERINLTVDGKRIQNFTGKGNSIMPGQQRRFTFDYPRTVTAKEVQFGR